MKALNEIATANSIGFDFLFPKGKDWFSPREVGDIIGCSDQYIRNSVYSGKIMAHIVSKDPENNTDNKSYIRIHKQSVLMYLMETANYTSDSFVEKLHKILSKRSDFELLRIEKIVKDLLYTKRDNRTIRRF